MNEDLCVRFAKAEDIHFVSQDGYIPASTVARKIEFNEVIVAEKNGKPVGYLRLEYLWSIVPYIALITILPTHQRQGAGKAMLDFTAAYLAENGHEWLYSSSQADEAEPQAWHRRMGFQDCGILIGINEGGISEIFFRKKIELAPK
jgi:N-acetylglutamate synthase-like GNAT family acetyltransferase